MGEPICIDEPVNRRVEQLQKLIGAAAAWARWQEQTARDLRHMTDEHMEPAERELYAAVREYEGHA